MKKTLLSAAVLAMLTTGCVSTHKGNVTSPNIDVEVKNSQRANIQVGKKVMATSESNVLFGIFSFGGDNKFADGVNYGGPALSIGIDSAASTKSAAAYKAIESSKADVLVAPKYTTVVTDYFVFKKIKATVEAYKGTIKGFTQVNK